MYSTILKKTLLSISIVVLMAMACDLSVTLSPSTSPAPLPTNTSMAASETFTSIPASVTLIAATVAPNATAITPQPSFEGTEVIFGSLRIIVPPGLASGVRGSQFARAEGPGVAPWDVTPGHTQLKLDGYLLQGKSQQPQILVYPAEGYGEQYPGAFESIHRLNNILGGLTISSDQLPAVPFFNAEQTFASNVQVVSFQNGRGVRFLTEYSQYPASANNTDLFYHFQGLTSDGAHYIIAILPITVPVVAETSDGGAVLPAAGIPYPYFADPNADMQAYYSAVTALLNATSPESFSPTINQLDLLVQSMRITP
jgi:hypothetical protein